MPSAPQLGSITTDIPPPHFPTVCLSFSLCFPGGIIIVNCSDYISVPPSQLICSRLGNGILELDELAPVVCVKDHGDGGGRRGQDDGEQACATVELQ